MGDGLEASAWCEVTAPACDIGIPINDLILSSGPEWTRTNDLGFIRTTISRAEQAMQREMPFLRK